MGKYDINPLLDMLKEKAKNKPEKYNIFICGPSYRESRLRVYAYGGVLCKLPTRAAMEKQSEQSKIKLLSSKYQKHLSKNPSLFASMQGLKDNEAKDIFLREHLDDLLSAMENWSKSETDVDKERSQQTIIARRHTNFQGPEHKGTIVCDFQFGVQKKYGPEGEKQPIFDLVTFSGNKAGGVFTLVEYKCSAKTCKGGKGESGLKDHAEDMLKCLPPNSEASDWCKRQLLNRLRLMRDYKLLQDCPEGLEHLTPGKMDLRAAFLFTPGGGLQSREDAAALCRAYIPEADLDKFSYCYAEDPESVDLSDMQSWEMFSNR